MVAFVAQKNFVKPEQMHNVAATLERQIPSSPAIANKFVGRSAIGQDRVIVFSLGSMQNFVPSKKSSPSSPV
jgi:hypothetical protein